MFKKYDIFLTYRSVDARIAGRIRDKLAQRGYKVFRDKDNLIAGQEYDRGDSGLLANIKKSKCIVVLINETACADFKKHQSGDSRDWVTEEILEAKKHGLKCMPVLLDDAEMPRECVPESIREYLTAKHALPIRKKDDYLDRDVSTLKEKLLVINIKPSWTNGQKTIILLVIVLIIFLLSIARVVDFSSNKGSQKRNPDPVKQPVEIVHNKKAEVAYDASLKIKQKNCNDENDGCSNYSGIKHKFSLTIKTYPPSAKVYITNIKPKYKDGILLEIGDYNIKVVSGGFKTKKFSIKLDKDIKKKVILQEIKPDLWTRDEGIEGIREVVPISKTKFYYINNTLDKYEINFKGRAFIIISVREQGSDGRIYAVDESGTVWFSDAITTGQPSINRTPSGIWNIKIKERDSISQGRLNKDEYSLLFSNKNIAIHQGSVEWMTGDMSIQVRKSSMRRLFQWAKIGFPILITRNTYMPYARSDLIKFGIQ